MALHVTATCTIKFASGHDWVHLSRDFALPFAPFPGLIIELADTSEIVVKSVLWIDADNAFVVNTGDVLYDEPKQFVINEWDGWMRV